MFTFDIMSKNSIVNGYDVSFSMPQGRIGNMYALQSMKGGDQLFAASEMLDDILSLNELDALKDKQITFSNGAAGATF